MKVDTISNPGGMILPRSTSAEQIDSQRKSKDSSVAEQQDSENLKIQPEELLDKIKSLTQDGLYSVRFEKDKKSSELVVKIFDNATEKIIRQIPPEELLNFKATFEELIGNLVNTEG